MTVVDNLLLYFHVYAFSSPLIHREFNDFHVSKGFAVIQLTSRWDKQSARTQHRKQYLAQLSIVGLARFASPLKLVQTSCSNPLRRQSLVAKLLLSDEWHLAFSQSHSN